MLILLALLSHRVQRRSRKSQRKHIRLAQLPLSIARASNVTAYTSNESPISSQRKNTPCQDTCYSACVITLLISSLIWASNESKILVLLMRTTRRNSWTKSRLKSQNSYNQIDRLSTSRSRTRQSSNQCCWCSWSSHECISNSALPRPTRVVQTSGALSDAIRPNSIPRQIGVTVFPRASNCSWRALLTENNRLCKRCLASLYRNSFMDSTLYLGDDEDVFIQSPPLKQELFSTVVFH
jgi:hypothetical protein